MKVQNALKRISIFICLATTYFCNFWQEWKVNELLKKVKFRFFNSRNHAASSGVYFLEQLGANLLSNIISDNHSNYLTQMDSRQSKVASQKGQNRRGKGNSSLRR